MKSNISDNVFIRNCTGCGICASICYTKAIRIDYDTDGFFKPMVDNEKCIECGQCKRLCYKYDEDFVMSDDTKVCYAAWNKDADQLAKSSSGGVSYLLMKECITQGYKVFGCTYDLEQNNAKSIVVSTIEDLDKFYGSKYFQSYTVNGFEEITKDNSNQKYAIFGTPCQIYAFSKSNKYKRTPENYLLVDIFCHGCPSIKLWNAYRQRQEEKLNITKFDNITFRSKTYGWHEYCIDFFVNNKKHSSKKISDSFFDLFFGADIMNDACYDCKARSTMAYTDIRIGDFWGTKYEMNNKGVSAVIVKSDLGQSFISAIAEKMYMEQADFDTIIAAQSYGKVVKHDKKRRGYLLHTLGNGNNVDSVHSKYLKMLPIKKRIKMRLKAIVKLLPPTLYFPIRKVLHSL